MGGETSLQKPENAFASLFTSEDVASVNLKTAALQNTLVVCDMGCLPSSTHKMMTATWLQAASTYLPSQTYL
eukprot:8825810-Ditylum_brightwellii.AAC.1